jgi:hypothetical protein
MKRFEIEQGDRVYQAAMSEYELGDYVLYEEARTIEIDRDIKATNLQLLVDAVLMWETQSSVFKVAPEVQPQWDELLVLARGLKQ